MFSFVPVHLKHETFARGAVSRAVVATCILIVSYILQHFDKHLF